MDRLELFRLGLVLFCLLWAFVGGFSIGWDERGKRDKRKS